MNDVALIPSGVSVQNVSLKTVGVLVLKCLAVDGPHEYSTKYIPFAS